jgi:hypothetical protein
MTYLTELRSENLVMFVHGLASDFHYGQALKVGIVPREKPPCLFMSFKTPT